MVGRALYVWRMARLRRLVIVVGLVAVTGCRERPPGAAPPVALARAAPPPDHVAPPTAPVTVPPPRFVTPANPDVEPQPSVVTRVVGKAERRDLGGGWRVTVQPADISAATGDEVERSLDFRASRLSGCLTLVGLLEVETS